MTSCSSDVGGIVQLTRREAEVVRLLAEGRSQKAIAAQLAIARRTVKAHIQNAKLRNGVGRTAALVFLFLTEGEEAERD